jgi:EAL domain-containing protein (putative c-di-GMP-specific phosphodiesterase class I)
MKASSSASNLGNVCPFLEHYPEMDGRAHRIKLDPLPFRIGRDPASHFVVPFGRVSKHHAEISWSADSFRIHDLGSTNGTFLNGSPVTDAPLKSGDILHFAHKEFRFILPEAVSDSMSGEKIRTDRANKEETPQSLIHGTDILREILQNRQVHVLFQPIVHLDTRDIVAFEMLGRCDHPELGPSPSALLKLADKCQMAPEISRLWRSVAFQEALRIPGNFSFFFNIHPSELLDQMLARSLAATAAAFQNVGCRLVMEIHEDTTMNTVELRKFHTLLRSVGVGLAFDDFGTGQIRLAEMTAAPPDLIKIDMHLIRDIDQSLARQDIVRALIQVASRLGVQVIAEGVETKEEADTCRHLGCVFGQGYLFGHPAPAANFTKVHRERTVVESDKLSRDHLMEQVRLRRESRLVQSSLTSPLLNPQAGKNWPPQQNSDERR